MTREGVAFCRVVYLSVELHLIHVFCQDSKGLLVVLKIYRAFVETEIGEDIRHEVAFL